MKSPELINFLIIRNKIRNRIFHISSGKPQNICAEPVIMEEIASVIDLADQMLVRRQPAGRIDIAVTVVSDRNGGVVGVLGRSNLV